MRGLPDWGRPIAGKTAWLYAPFQRNGAPLALPNTLSIATEPDGRPAFRILAIRELGPFGAAGRGRIDIEFQLATNDEDARAVPAERGWLRLRSAMLDLPAELLRPVELDCSGLCLARLVLPLAPEGVAFVEQALADGALPVIATVDVEVAGIAPRLQGRAVIDVAVLAAVLAAGTMTPAVLRDLVAADPGSAGVKLEDIDPDTPMIVAAEAVADHVRSALCAGPLRPAEDAGLALCPFDPTLTHGRAVLDLGRTIIATRTVALELDPFLAARALAADRGGGAALIERTSGAPLPTGRHRITIDCSVRRPLIGPLALGATLRFPPRPPARMHEVRRDFELPTDGSSVEQHVQLSPSEPLEWTLAAFAFWPAVDHRGVEQLLGETHAGTGAQALLRTSAFPLMFVEVEVEARLIHMAEVAVTLTGEWSDQPADTAVTLSAARPRAALALPVDASAPQMTVMLTPRGPGVPIMLGPIPAADWRIELADLPGYGPRSLEITVSLPAGVPLAAIEVLPEDADASEEPAPYAFTPSNSSRTHGWFCRDPFRPGLLWRWRGHDEFSVPVRGTNRLDLAANESVVV